MSYSTSDFVRMVNDEPRADAYAAALRAVVQPGDRVVDLGCGFGFLSVVACRAGASHVDAVDVHPVIAFGARVAAANGCDDRITFHHVDARRLQLEPKADVLVGDLRGSLPLAGDHLQVLTTARRTLLRPGGRVVARRDTVWVAPCVASQTFHEVALAPRCASTCDVAPLQAHLRTVPYRTTVRPSDLLGAGSPWVSIDYEQVTSLDADGTVALHVSRDGVLEAVALWFDTELAPAIGFSNAPGTAVDSYRQTLLPLQRAVAVRAGDVLTLSLRARHTERGYVWHWRGSRDGTLLFDQNSLVEFVPDLSLMPPAPASLLPARSVRADALYWLLGQMGSGASVSALASAANARWPELFSSVTAAQAWVQRTVQKIDSDERGVE